MELILDQWFFLEWWQSSSLQFRIIRITFHLMRNACKTFKAASKLWKITKNLHTKYIIIKLFFYDNKLSIDFIWLMSSSSSSVQKLITRSKSWLPVQINTDRSNPLEIPYFLHETKRTSLFLLIKSMKYI